MASIDAVTTSFTASLTVAEGGSAPDLGKIGGGFTRRSPQPFLIGKPLTRKPVDPKAEFRVQERVGDLFLFSFESMCETNKVLRSGGWCFDRALICFEEYDDVKPLHEDLAAIGTVSNPRDKGKVLNFPGLLA